MLKKETQDLNKQKIEKDSQFSFNDLKREIETITDKKKREQVMKFINELENYCQEYIEIEQFYEQARNQVQEANFMESEDRKTALNELEIWIQAKESKGKVILDNLNILSRFFENCGLDASWQPKFANKQILKEWVIKNKESGN